MDSTPHTIGERIRFWRECRRHKQAYMAAELGITQSVYSDYESDKTSIPAIVLFKISQILNIDSNQLNPYTENVISSLQNNSTPASGSIVHPASAELYERIINSKDQTIIHKTSEVKILHTEIKTLHTEIKTLHSIIGRKKI